MFSSTLIIISRGGEQGAELLPSMPYWFFSEAPVHAASEGEKKGLLRSFFCVINLSLIFGSDDPAMYDDFLARIIEPDAFLPSQFYGNRALSRQLDGEKKLMLAILKDGVECLEKYRGAKSSIGKGLYENALDWVEDKSTAWPFS